MALDLYFKNRVGPSFNCALASMDSVISTLSNYDVSKHSNFKRVIPQLRYDIRNVYDQMQEANAIASDVVRQSNEELEDLVKEEGTLMQEKTNKEEDVAELKNIIDGLQTEKNDIENKVEESKREEKEANRLLESARNELQAKRNEQNVVRGVGVGLFAIPVVGWIAGAGLVALSFTALEENVASAVKARDDAQDHVNSTQRQLKNNIKELDENKKRMKRRKNELSAINERLRNVKRQLKDQRMNVSRQAEMNDKIKQCFHFVSVCFGRTDVLEFQSRHLFCFEQLVLPLRELSSHLLGAPQNHYRCIQGDFDVKTVGKKLRQICDKNPDVVNKMLEDFL
ncbi:DNA repair protein RAD50-like [Limulus polyphemus]|uniref:DNA repair protein RAD50-like n=1 Tax=Limulus polyphemus TaxID=6850 RepID=A0ABM1BVW2_LIMPO|nr:DNA repair protein RAD50-like [Limulus polyphemus]